MQKNFQNLISTFRKTIFTWSYFCNFPKIEQNTFKIKVQLNILNSLIWEQNIEDRFLEIVIKYPEVREVLPILLAVREKFNLILDEETKEILEVKYLFDKKVKLDIAWEKELIKFFKNSWLQKIFENKHIKNLEDYVFGIETWLDSNARKNRSWTLMENLVEDFIKDFCDKNNCEYKEQATAKWIKENWWIEVKSDKSSRRFDFWIFNKETKTLSLIEVNYYGWWWSKLKSVSWEFNYLYKFLQEQWVQMFWITDWLWWKTALKPLEEAYYATNWNIYNLKMLKEGILDEIIE